MPLPNSLNSYLLYPRLVRIELRDLAGMLNDLFSPSGYTLEELEYRSGQRLVLAHDDLTVTFRLEKTRLDEEPLLELAEEPFHQAERVDWADMVRIHRYHGEVTVELAGRTPPDPAMFELMLSICQMATTALSAMMPPSMIYWAQSEQLFLPSKFQLMDDMLFPLPLYLKPRLFSSGRMQENIQVLGTWVDGAELFLGRPLVFEEAPVTVQWLQQRVYAFVEHYRQNELPADGDTFGIEPEEVIRVNMKGRGPISLTLRERGGMLVLQPDPKAPRATGVAEPDDDPATAMVLHEPEPAPVIRHVPPDEEPVKDGLSAEEKLRRASALRLAEERAISRDAQFRHNVFAVLLGARGLFDVQYRNRNKVTWGMTGFSLFLTPLVGIPLAILNWKRGPHYYVTAFATFGAVLLLALSPLALRYSLAGQAIVLAGLDDSPAFSNLSAPTNTTF
ncbi:MAG: hypothetical protein AAFQ66_03120 [Pseudomonadota bacterium]